MTADLRPTPDSVSPLPGFSRKWGSSAVMVALAVLFFMLYFLTAQRGISWQDSGEFQYRIFSGDYRWCSGIARAHPLYIAGARAWMALFPGSLQVWAVNSFSGLGMALAVAAIFTLVLRLTRDTAAALVAALTLGLSHMCWWMSCMAEVYTWSLALFMGELLALHSAVKSGRTLPLLALFLLNGLHLSVHNFALLNLPVHGLVLLLEARKRRSFALLPLAGTFWALGAAPIIWLAVQDLLGGMSPVATVKSALFGLEFEGYVLSSRTGVRWKMVAFNYALAVFSLINPCWLFAAVNLKRRGDPAHIVMRRALAALTVIHLLFWARYFVGDQATFVMPTLGLLAVWVGLGAAALPVVDRRRVVMPALLCGITVSVAVPALCGKLLENNPRLIPVTRPRELPGRNEMAYWLVPWKNNEHSAADFVGLINAKLQPGDLLIADNTSAAPLLAARVIGKLSNGWELVNYLSDRSEDAVRRQLAAAKRKYIVSPVRNYELVPFILDGDFRFRPSGPVYEIFPNN
ncbi:MAG: DUF2723 domain-containing protein [Kiritimatiellae bacterium]|nr:DUF2723 domain-containing protein [Kiritimatiellia bacterium]